MIHKLALFFLVKFAEKVVGFASLNIAELIPNGGFGFGHVD